MNKRKGNKSVLLALSFVLLGLGSYGQTDLRDEVSFGLKAGINNSNVWDERDESFEADFKNGLAVGGFLHLPLNEYIGFQPELMYSQKGFEGSGTFLGQRYSYTLTSNHLDVPILFVVKPAPSISIVAGPQYSYLLSERSTFNSQFYSEEEFNEYEANDIRKNRFGVNVGFDININQFVISPRASWDLHENHSDGTSSTPRYKNEFYQLTVGFRF
ncbi:MAG: porin family protein [Fluviicola sp.]